MAKKTDPVPARPEDSEPQEFRFRVTSDNYAPANRGQVVTLPTDEATAALVEAGHLEPMSKGASVAVEEAANEP
jgi:hypothetical protein